MIQLNIAATIASVIIILLIFLWLTRKQLELGTGDVWQNVWSSVVKFGLKNLNKGDIHKRNWEPNILLFSGGTNARPHLLEFGASVAGRNGMISNFDLVEDKTAKVLFPKQDQSILNEEAANDAIFYRKKTCRNLYEGIETISSTYGFSGVEPNTVLLGWARNIQHPERFAEMTETLHELDYNVLFLDYDKEKGFGNKQKIDIWWRDLSQISYFTVQLVKLINASPDWSSAEIRFLYFDTENNDKILLEEEMQKRVSELRNNVESKVVAPNAEQHHFYEVVMANSIEADLIIIDLPDLGQDKAEDFVKDTSELLDVLGTTLLVKASSHFYEESDFNTTLEKIYSAEDATSITETTRLETDIYLGQCRYEPLDTHVTSLDNGLHELNIELGSKIYNGYSEVLTTFISLLKEETPDQNAYAKAVTLIQDFRENRLDKVSNHLSQALNEQFDLLGAFIDKMPQKVVRFYSPEELVPQFGDTDEILKFKKSIQRLTSKPRSNILLKKISRKHFDNTYLIHFEKVLHAFGESALVLNTIIKKWTYSLDQAIDNSTLANAANELEAQIDLALQEEKARFIVKLDTLGRKFCNTIVKEIDHLHNDRLPCLDTVKPRATVMKAVKKNIIQYPQYWHQNTQYLNNHLLLNLHLQALKRSVWPAVFDVKEALSDKMLAPSSLLLTNIHENIDTFTEDNIRQYESGLIEAGSALDIDESIKDLMLKIDKQLVAFCQQTEVIPARQIERFESMQMEIVSENIDVNKVTAHLLDNEVLLELKSSFQTAFNEIKSELIKVENALRLLKYSWSSNQSESSVLLDEVKVRVSKQFQESQAELNAIDLRLQQQTEDTHGLLNTLLTDDVIIKRASQMNAIIRKERARKGFKRYTNYLKEFWETSNNQLDNWAIKLRDLWTISDHQYRTKALQNPHARLANYVDNIALESSVEKQIPFFYHQLFTGKHSAPTLPLANRVTEWQAAQKAIERFRNGSNGAVLFTGEPLSGLSYLLENVVNTLVKKKVYYIKSPTRHSWKAEKLIQDALVLATDIHEETTVVLSKLPAGTTLVFEDLELWWTRRDKGSDFIVHINELVAQHGHRLLFMLSCNVYFYQHIRQYVNLDANLLDTIMIKPLATEEIKRILLKRHHSGGMTYYWKSQSEENLGIREQNKLFKRITAASEGNIGTALHLWLGNIKSMEDNKLHLGPLELKALPPVLSADWEIMLLQVLLHKQLTFRRLCSVYNKVDNQTVRLTMESLLRAQLLVETGGKMIKINPYVLPYLVQYFRKNEVV